LIREADMLRLDWKYLVCLAALACFVGCPGGGGSIGTAPVTGTVTLDGNPVDGAKVVFSPKSAGGRAAVGTTDASGKFSLTTLEAGDGAIPGSYQVSISKTAAPQAAFQDPRSKGGEVTPEQSKAIMEAAKAGAGATAPESLIPEIYAKADTSGFTAEVKASGKNDFSFEMKSQ
jgi:hypothetical protein